jgi:hypothetical protein
MLSWSRTSPLPSVRNVGLSVSVKGEDFEGELDGWAGVKHAQQRPEVAFVELHSMKCVRRTGARRPRRK